MKIEQFEDKGLAHYSYAILSDCAKEIVLIDPARDPQPYYDFAEKNEAKIIGIIETHPHADFVSSHLEIQKKAGATIYTHSLVGADYPHQAFDEGTVLELGKIKLRSLHTPGHSPGHLSFWRERDRALLAFDVLFGRHPITGRPGLFEPPDRFTIDPARNREQIRRLASLEPELVCFGHGPPLRGAAGPLRAFADSLSPAR